MRGWAALSLVSMEISSSRDGQYLPEGKLPCSYGRTTWALSQAPPRRENKRNHGSSPVPTGELPCCRVSLTADTKLLTGCFHPSYTWLFSTQNLNQCIPGAFLSRKSLWQSHPCTDDQLHPSSQCKPTAYSGLPACLTPRMGLGDLP